MAQVTLPNTLTANTLAEASKVMANFTAITAQVNGGLDTTNLKDGAVTEGKVADNAVNAVGLAAGAVTEPKLATGAVTESKLGAGAVTETKLGAASVTAAKLAPGAAAANLGAGEVTETMLAAASVTEAKLGTGSVTSAKIADAAVSLVHTAFLNSLPAGTKLFFGHVHGSGGTLPSGWSRSTIATGQYRITHNLGSGWAVYPILSPWVGSPTLVYGGRGTSTYFDVYVRSVAETVPGGLGTQAILTATDNHVVFIAVAIPS